jgi:hypothetical protein
MANQLVAGGHRHYRPAGASEPRAAAEQPLELAADLHGKRWRADLAGFGGAAEMPMYSAAASKQRGPEGFIWSVLLLS